ncbi:hypothetical protein [Pseudomonas syringae group genomosp. 3]|uniref:hypothetical protein n=1 Tax=Pseudomonas syringae group genomosp. 3 TaxID=251701 RepID=UPI001605381E|nr:hypothetical protein [Pseudomonas syringae group genomosp. 3]
MMKVLSGEVFDLHTFSVRALVDNVLACHQNPRITWSVGLWSKNDQVGSEKFILPVDKRVAGKMTAAKLPTISVGVPVGKVFMVACTPLNPILSTDCMKNDQCETRVSMTIRQVAP